MRAHFGESRIGYLWAIIEPILHLAGFVLIMIVLLKRHAPMGSNATLFVMTAVLPYFLYAKLASYIASSIESNRALFNLPPIRPLDVVLARTILETATYLLVGFLLAVGLLLSGVSEAVPAHPLELATAIAVVATFGMGFGMINLVIRIFITNWSTFFSLVTGPLYLLSGIWWLPEQVPQPLRDYLLYNPLAHFVMWSRAGWYRDYNPEYLDRPYALAWALGALVAGLALMRIARRKVLEPT
jgi:capsular polysaccharide transport system permease protein